MTIDSYFSLQDTIMDWLARPGDPLISGAVPEFISLFEEEARDRLKTRFNEIETTLTPAPNNSLVPLPLDFWELRELYLPTSWGNVHYTYQTPPNMDTNLYRGSMPYGYTPTQGWVNPNYPKAAFTIEGLNLRLLGDPGPTPDPLTMVYMQGVYGLTTQVPTNWLLHYNPSLYLFGSLTMAEPYIGNDERFPLWAAQKEAGFNRLQLSDRKARFSGGPLVIQTDVRNP